MIEERIYVVFDELDNGTLSDVFNDLNLNRHFDDNRLSSLKTHNLIRRLMLKIWKDNINVLFFILQLKTLQRKCQPALSMITHHPF